MAPQEIFDYDPRKLPQDLLSAIGLSIACAAHTEYVVEQAIGGCLGLDVVYTSAVTTHMVAPLRLSVLKAAAEIRISNLDDLDRLDELIEKIDRANQKRNDVAHNSWVRDPKSGEIFTQKTTARGSVDTKFNSVNVVEIETDALAIYTAGIELFTFLNEKNLLPNFPSSPIDRSERTKASRKNRKKGDY